MELVPTKEATESNSRITALMEHGRRIFACSHGVLFVYDVATDSNQTTGWLTIVWPRIIYVRLIHLVSIPIPICFNDNGAGCLQKLFNIPRSSSLLMLPYQTLKTALYALETSITAEIEQGYLEPGTKLSEVSRTLFVAASLLPTAREVKRQRNR